MTDGRIPKLRFCLFDKVCYHEGNYYAESTINRIDILPDKIIYYTDTPRSFTNEDIGVTIFASAEEAKEFNNMKADNIICDRREKVEELLTPYIGKPVYVKGYCWGKAFDGWTVLYDDGIDIVFDYRGETYTAVGFLPSRFTMWTDSSYDNAFFDSTKIQ